MKKPGNETFARKHRNDGCGADESPTVERTAFEVDGALAMENAAYETDEASDRTGNINHGSAKVISLDRKEQLQKKRRYWVFRRAQDVVFSGAAMVMLSPLLLITALLIYIDDPKGSPIFSQIRVGRDGKEFKFYKFRSMCMDAEEKLEELLGQNEMDGPVFKIKDDPRITRIGRFIRKTSIDELPQLWNIFKGDMSIVGPRPALPREAEQYGEYERQRLYVQPGLTCYWQIQPHRNDLSFEEWMELDIKYIRERSFLVDWKIIFSTVRAVLSGQGE